MDSQVQADMMAELRRLMPGLAIQGTQNGATAPSRSDPTILKKAPSQRPWQTIIDDLLSDREKGDQYIANNSKGDPDDRLIRCNVIKARGDALLRRSLHEAALPLYLKAASCITGKAEEESRLPFSLVESSAAFETYSKLPPWSRVDLMICYDDIVQCLHKLDRNAEALEWLEEVNILGSNFTVTADKPAFDWVGAGIDLPDYYYQRLASLRRATDVSLKIANTGTATYRLALAETVLNGMPGRHRDRRTSLLHIAGQLSVMTQFRHPDPKALPNFNALDDALQIRGSWQKLHFKKSGGVTSRMGFSHFVWKGRLYVAGGEANLELLGNHYRDLWCLDLEKRDGWRELAPYPHSFSSVGRFMGWTMAVHQDKAYLFTGRPQVDYFDLINERWGSVSTTFSSSWPYPKKQLFDYSMQLVDGCLYVFGGTHDGSNLGCNLFMKLDLKTLKWKALTGSAKPVADASCPGPRRHAMSWVDGEAERIYVGHGDADRMAAQAYGEHPHGADDGYVYEDLWSWGIADGKWRRERMAGNVPSARSEMACTYNHQLKQALVFGGYSPTTPTSYEQTGQTFAFSYYADTFICDTSSTNPTWKQVITRGFPTYRAQGKLFVDSATGKTYMFGGYTNGDFVPSRKQTISRTFADLWQLRIDEPGGFFEEVDLDEESRTARLGPWQRCFTCGGTGQWKRCGGSCGGTAYFCDAACQKEGWKEHKSRHKCHKK